MITAAAANLMIQPVPRIKCCEQNTQIPVMSAQQTGTAMQVRMNFPFVSRS